MLTINKDIFYVSPIHWKEKELFYLNICIVLPKTSQAFTPAEVDPLQHWDAPEKIAWKSNQASAPGQGHHFESWKLQEHIS